MRLSTSGEIAKSADQTRGHWPTTRGWRPNRAVRARKPSEHNQASPAAKTLHALLAIRRLWHGRQGIESNYTEVSAETFVKLADSRGQRPHVR